MDTRNTAVRDAISALAHLRAALTYLKASNAPKTAKRVRLAISSCKGAVRNANAKATRKGGA